MINYEKKIKWHNEFISSNINNDAIDYEALCLVYSDKNLKERAIKISNTFGPRKDGKDGFARVEDMIVNYRIETQVLKTMQELYDPSFDFYDYGSCYFHTGKGDNVPDYIDSNNITYELKRYNCQYTDWRWHNADIHLCWFNDKLYKQESDNSLKFIAYCPKIS